VTDALSLDTIFPIIAIASLLFAIYQIRRNRREHAGRELQRLEWATDEVRGHGHALDQFIHCPDAPEGLKKFLLAASDALEGHDFACLMARKLQTGTGLEREDENSENDIWSQVLMLSATNPAVYNLFVQALYTGIAAAFLRWPDTASVLARPLAPTQDNIKREIVTTARAVRENNMRSWPDGMIAA
jgi:hypothetical protein